MGQGEGERCLCVCECTLYKIDSVDFYRRQREFLVYCEILMCTLDVYENVQGNSIRKSKELELTKW